MILKCTLLIADMFCFVMKKDFMMSISVLNKLILLEVLTKFPDI